MYKKFSRRIYQCIRKISEIDIPMYKKNFRRIYQCIRKILYPGYKIVSKLESVHFSLAVMTRSHVTYLSFSSPLFCAQLTLCTTKTNFVQGEHEQARVSRWDSKLVVYCNKTGPKRFWLF